MLLVSVLLLSLLAVECSSLGTPMDTYIVNLDQPPAERWASLVPIYKSKLAAVINYVKGTLPAGVFSLLTDVLADLDRYIGAPYADEMRGLAASSGYPLGDVVLMNVFYELTAGCTSLVARNSANGSVIHGRNLDFNVEHLGPVSFQVIFQRNGSDVYRGTTFAGYVGLLTGMKLGNDRWTVSLDQRYVDGSVAGAVINGFEALLRGGRVTVLEIRNLLDQGATFQTAAKTLSAVHFTAPSYLILSAPRTGVVITRDREGANLWWLEPSALPPALVETNYDHWKAPPKDDDRRDPAYRNLNSTNYATYGTETILHNVMQKAPNRNDMTVYTTVMEAATETYYSFVYLGAV